MFDSDDNDFHASIKALNDVVLPAVDKANPIALQQLRYVIDYLIFHRQRRALQPWFDRALLLAHIAMAREVADRAPASKTPSLKAAIKKAERQAEVAASVQAQTREQVTALEDEISALVRASATFVPQERDTISSVVVAASKPIVDLQRVWNAPLSIEPDLAALPSLAKALDLPAELKT